MRRLVVTADDFGLAPEVNEAVEAAHRNGILTAASLMVAEPAAAQAVAIARRTPTLAVGLHLTLVEGRPVLPPTDIPDLVDREGRFRTDLARAGAAQFFLPHVRRQLAREIAAQFEAFAATGLPLDHVNAHRHYHLHPTVARLVLAIGPRFGMRALRVPVEPLAPLRAVEPGTGAGEGRLTAPFAALLRRAARRHGLVVPDQVFGLAWTGAMTAKRIAGLLAHLPPGLTEIYTHPATADAFEGSAPVYRYREELAGLTSPDARAGLMGATIRTGGFGDAA